MLHGARQDEDMMLLMIDLQVVESTNRKARIVEVWRGRKVYMIFVFLLLCLPFAYLPPLLISLQGYKYRLVCGEDK